MPVYVGERGYVSAYVCMFVRFRVWVGEGNNLGYLFCLSVSVLSLSLYCVCVCACGNGVGRWGWGNNLGWLSFGVNNRVDGGCGWGGGTTQAQNKLLPFHFNKNYKFYKIRYYTVILI